MSGYNFTVFVVTACERKWATYVCIPYVQYIRILCTHLCVLYTYNYGFYSSDVCIWLHTEVMLAACVGSLVQQKVLLLGCMVHTHL